MTAPLALAPLLIPALLAAPLAGQRHEGLRPFREPTRDVLLPPAVFEDLQSMLRLAASPGRFEVRYDDEGREVCAHPAWQRARARLEQKLDNMAGTLGIVLRDSSNPAHRRAAAYGAFYLDEVEHVFQLIAFFPGEPERATREEAYRRAIAFLRVHLPENAPAAAEDAGGRPPRPRYELNTFPYLCLLALDDPRDRAQGLWFLKEVVKIRPDMAPGIVEEARPHLAALVSSDDAAVRREARGLVRAADPEGRRAPPRDAPDAEVRAWLRDVLDDVLPPVRAVSEGITELHPSELLDRIAETGRAALERDALGGPKTGKLRSGMLYRGYRIARLPDPLERLRLPLGAVIVRVNGEPVATAEGILDRVRFWLQRERRLLVEYVHEGDERAMEYRLR